MRAGLAPAYVPAESEASVEEVVLAVVEVVAEALAEQASAASEPEAARMRTWVSAAVLPQEADFVACVATRAALVAVEGLLVVARGEA